MDTVRKLPIHVKHNSTRNILLLHIQSVNEEKLWMWFILRRPATLMITRYCKYMNESTFYENQPYRLILPIASRLHISSVTIRGTLIIILMENINTQHYIYLQTSILYSSSVTLTNFIVWHNIVPEPNVAVSSFINPCCSWIHWSSLFQFQDFTKIQVSSISPVPATNVPSHMFLSEEFLSSKFQHWIYTRKCRLYKLHGYLKWI